MHAILFHQVHLFKLFIINIIKKNTVNTQMHIKNLIYEIITIDINIKKSYDNTSFD